LRWLDETTRSAPKGWDECGMMRGSRFYSPKASHLRKGRRSSRQIESEEEESELAVGKSWRKKMERGGSR
jgi:hypothetical protein